MVSKEQRRHELARAKLARQQARREADAAKRRTMAIVAAVLGVLLVVGTVTFLTVRDDDTLPAAAAPTTDASETTEPPVAGGCAYVPAGEPAVAVTPPPDGPPPTAGATAATITTSQGPITIALEPEVAPCTVQSFVSLAQQGYFDGTTCHRLTTSGTLAVLQCGDPTGTGSGGPGYSFADETTADMVYDRGTVAMANSGPDTNGSQFFLVHGDSQLPPDYTVFGTITEGLELLDAVAAAGVSPDAGSPTDGAPATPVEIETVTVLGGEPLAPEGSADPSTDAEPSTGTEPAESPATGTEPAESPTPTGGTT